MHVQVGDLITFPATKVAACIQNMLEVGCWGIEGPSKRGAEYRAECGIEVRVSGQATAKLKVQRQTTLTLVFLRLDHDTGRPLGPVVDQAGTFVDQLEGVLLAAGTAEAEVLHTGLTLVQVCGLVGLEVTCDFIQAAFELLHRRNGEGSLGEQAEGSLREILVFFSWLIFSLSGFAAAVNCLGLAHLWVLVAPFVLLVSRGQVAP